MNSYRDNIKTLCKGKTDLFTQNDVDIDDGELVVFYPEGREDSAVCMNKDDALNFWNSDYGISWGYNSRHERRDYLKDASNNTYYFPMVKEIIKDPKHRILVVSKSGEVRNFGPDRRPEQIYSACPKGMQGTPLCSVKEQEGPIKSREDVNYSGILSNYGERDTTTRVEATREQYEQSIAHFSDEERARAMTSWDRRHDPNYENIQAEAYVTDDEEEYDIIELTYSSVTDVSALRHVHTLDLSYSRRLTDVSMLGGVHTLNLSSCKNITDVSALGGVHNLNLRGCSGVTDVSALGGVHTLNLSYCGGVTDVSALGGVFDLDLSFCRGVTDVSMLGGVHTLNLSNCKDVTDVSALGSVHTLDLRSTGVTDFSALGGVVNLIT
jgi:hypothetical protein